jgi:hypothetical protein
MGFTVKQPLETDQGLLAEAYVRIEMYRVEVYYGILHATVAMYPSRQAAMETVPHYFGEGNPNPSQVIGVRLVYKGEEMEYPTYFQFPMVEPVEIEVPLFEEVKEVVTSTYYDFDESGNIIEQTKETEKTKTVQTGTEPITKYKISINKNEGKVYEFAYASVKEEFGKIFGDENIIDE